MFNLARIKTAQVQGISLREVRERKLIGPVYHGTTDDNRERIKNEGFQVYIGESRTGPVSHGYQRSDYWSGIPAPIHHLGFGNYFTFSKKIAKDYAYGTTRGMLEYYLDAPNTLEINFGVPKTMMNWWLQNGYDAELAKQSETGRVEATQKLTDVLKSKYDAVYFKGRSLYRLLDGDQICIYDPSKIYYLDKRLTQSGEIGSKVRRKSDGVKGIIQNIIPMEEVRELAGINPNHYFNKYLEQYSDATQFLQVKWTPGGTNYNYIPDTMVDYL